MRGAPSNLRSTRLSIACSRRSWSPTAARSPSASSARCDELGIALGGGLLRARPRRAARRARRRGLPARRPDRRPRATSNVEKILEVVRSESGAEAVHPGYGFLAENARLRAGAARRRASRSSGRPPSAIEAMGSKTRARELMQDAGVPIVPGTTEPVETSRTRRRSSTTTIGYPVAVKAAGGGGGKGFRVALERVRARGRLRGRRARGREVLLATPTRLPRALPARPAPRRGPGPRRRARQRHPPRRARLLGAAPPPEAHRGVARARGRRGAARAHRQDRRRGRARGRLRRRRHDRGPAARTASTSSWR